MSEYQTIGQVLRTEFPNYEKFEEAVRQVEPRTNWHCMSIYYRCANIKGVKHHPSAVLRNPYLLFDKKIGKRLPI